MTLGPVRVMGAGAVVKAYVKVVHKTDFAETHAYCYEYFSVQVLWLVVIVVMIQLLS